MAELHDRREGKPVGAPQSPRRIAELQLIGKKAINASLELADELETS